MALFSLFLLTFLVLISSSSSQLQEFISIDCGGTRSNYTDTTTGITWISDSEIMKHGEKVEVKNPNGNQVQYQKRRDFPTDSRKYCYTLETEERRRPLNLSMYATDFEDDFFLKVAARINFGAPTEDAVRYPEDPYDRIWESDLVKRQNFLRTPDSTRGPLLNAMEISKYQEIASKTLKQDSNSVNAFANLSDEIIPKNEGDPCVPTSWEWVNCSTITPPRITKINLTRRNLTGEIPQELNNMDALEELWLDGNSLTGQLPDLSNLISLKIVHLENNKLTGSLPSYLGSLPSLQALYIQNNSFTGDIPAGLLSSKITFKYDDNPRLHKKNKKHFQLIIGTAIGVLVILLVLFLASLVLLHYLRKKALQKRSDEKGISGRSKHINGYSFGVDGNLMDEGTAYYINLSDLKEATNNFSKKIGKGSFGSVYYGKMKDGKEIAVKTMTDPSSHGNHQFATEVALLSRIHHRNLVPLIGYCEEEYQHILVYEYMHNGTLRDHIHECSSQKRFDWLTRLRIAEDSAKGLEYLHTGCNPSIIHRDVKTSNILLDINMRAKVSDFGLSRLAEEDLTHISSVARGTVGYLDPEYYANQQLTEKSDVYSFGVVLLELISGKKPVSPEDYGPEMNIVHWARSLIRKGDIISIMDPLLIGNVKTESIWRVAEIAMQCVEPHGASRPRMQEVILAIQDASKIEKGTESQLKISSSGDSKPQSSRKTLLTSFLEIESPDLSNGCLPSAR
ncbi:putative LRR receptor serine/threonine-protein kinase [Trifolium repens]|nr:putative LRR receptor serine/threonine-protein kinase [Trifolium repens]